MIVPEEIREGLWRAAEGCREQHRLVPWRIFGTGPDRYWMICVDCLWLASTAGIREALRRRLRGALLRAGYNPVFAAFVPATISKTYHFTAWMRLAARTRRVMA